MWSILHSALKLLGLCFLEDSTLMGSRTQQASWSRWGHLSPGWPHPLPYRSSLLIQPGHCTEELLLWLNLQNILGAVLLHTVYNHTTLCSPHSPCPTLKYYFTQYPRASQTSGISAWSGGLVKTDSWAPPIKFLTQKVRWGPRTRISNKLTGAADSTLNNMFVDDLEGLSGA